MTVAGTVLTLPAVRLEQVVVELQGRVILDGVDLDLKRGERVAFLGPSGAGKTTLLRLLNGTVRPTRGRVLVDGRDVNGLSGPALKRLRAGIGFIHQDLRLVGNLRVSQNVLSGGLGRRNIWQSARMMLAPASGDLDRVHELLEQVGIGEKMFQRVDRLSGGQAQRVALARALFQDPLLLAADEPVSSVDPQRAREILDLLAGVCEAKRLTLLVSLHDPDLARSHFPRLVGLRRGRILFDRETGAVAARDMAALYDCGGRDDGL